MYLSIIIYLPSRCTGIESKRNMIKVMWTVDMHVRTWLTRIIRIVVSSAMSFSLIYYCTHSTHSLTPPKLWWSPLPVKVTLGKVQKTEKPEWGAGTNEWIHLSPRWVKDRNNCLLAKWKVISLRASTTAPALEKGSLIPPSSIPATVQWFGNSRSTRTQDNHDFLLIDKC